MRFNIFYLVVLILLIGGLPFLRNKLILSDDFYGISETQVRTINFPHPVVIKKLFVQIGQLVQKGDTLVILERTDFDIKFQKIQYDIAAIQAKKELSTLEYESQKSKLAQRQQEILLSLQQKKLALTLEKQNAEQSLSQMKSIELSPLKLNENYQFKITQLQETSQLEIDELNASLHQLHKEWLVKEKGFQIELMRLQQEVKLKDEENKSLTITASETSIIGQIVGQEGDAISSYNDILRFYGQHPNMVTTYIGDGYLATVKLLDSAWVEPMHSLGTFLPGIVEGLGSRVTAFPDRLKKAPDLRLWGREIQIKIPITNNLLQGEKVKVYFKRPEIHG